MKIELKSPKNISVQQNGRLFLALVGQHGSRDVTCKRSIESTTEKRGKTRAWKSLVF